MVDLGRALLAEGRTAEAEKSLAEARTTYQKTPPPNDYYSAWADAWHGVALAAIGRPAEAIPLLTTAEGVLRISPACPRRHYLAVVQHLIDLYTAEGKRDDAAAWKRRLDEGK